MANKEHQSTQGTQEPGKPIPQSAQNQQTVQRSSTPQRPEARSNQDQSGTYRSAGNLPQHKAPEQPMQAGEKSAQAHRDARPTNPSDAVKKSGAEFKSTGGEPGSQFAGKIKEKMTVYCMDHAVAGKVDHLEAGAKSIKLTRDTTGQNHWIPMQLVVDVNDEGVHLNQSLDNVHKQWKATPPSSASM